MKSIVCILFFITVYQAFSQDTFSIVAVDPVTGEIGGAGASCLDDSQITGGVLIINDIMPGRGAIHTQSYWNPTNQQNAHNRMMEGLSPAQIIEWLFFNDVQNNPQVRQYGIVDFDPFGNPRSAAFTGSNCLDYKNHIIGPTYAIQGNILLGQQILDSMEARFLNTPGSLAEKLMAALQGANVPGADTRCLSEGVSSLSAFVRVAKTTDPPEDLYCSLVVTSTPYGVEPIDSLQILFDEWLNYVGINKMTTKDLHIRIYPNPFQDQAILSLEGIDPDARYEIYIYDLFGRMLNTQIIHSGRLPIEARQFGRGIYFYKILNNLLQVKTGKFVIN